jgi:hypothetical protein
MSTGDPRERLCFVISLEPGLWRRLPLENLLLSGSLLADLLLPQHRCQLGENLVQMFFLGNQGR